jgi:hypothetical protein
MPEPRVIAVRTERVEEDYIEYLCAHPMRGPTPLTEDDLKKFPWMPEATRVADVHINKVVDLQEDILRRYDKKGYTLVRVEHLDNGMRRLLVICPSAHHHTMVYRPKRILIQEGLGLLMGL